jgi:hypothetical protein
MVVVGSLAVARDHGVGLGFLHRVILPVMSREVVPVGIGEPV